MNQKTKLKSDKSKNVSPKIKQANIGDQENFRSYIDSIKAQSFILKERVKSLKTAQFIGKYSKYIESELSEEIERLKGTTMMVHQQRKLGEVTDRKIHIHNAGNIGYKIAKGIFRNEDIAKGVEIATLLHDTGQPALGHLGENTSSKISFYIDAQVKSKKQ